MERLLSCLRVEYAIVTTQNPDWVRRGHSHWNERRGGWRVAAPRADFRVESAADHGSWFRRTVQLLHQDSRQPDAPQKGHSAAQSSRGSGGREHPWIDLRSEVADVYPPFVRGWGQ